MHSQAKLTTMNNKLQFSDMTTCVTMIQFFFSSKHHIPVVYVPDRSPIGVSTKHAAFVLLRHTLNIFHKKALPVTRKPSQNNLRQFLK